MDAGCDAVKLEGADARLDRVRALVGAGIPVMGHVGLEPQTVDERRRLSACAGATPTLR